MIDPEEEFFPEEVEKVVADVTQKGLSLIVFAEWYNTSLIQALQFYDTNTKWAVSPFITLIQVNVC